jgi:hypothetical protein
VTDELGGDIVQLLREIETSARPGRGLSYESVEVVLVPAGSGRTVLTGAAGPIYTVRVRARDTVTGEIHSVEFADWEIGGLLDTAPGERKQRSAFAWLLHANLDEWWLTDLGKR